MSTGGEVANALVCKISIRGFNSRPVLQNLYKLLLTPAPSESLPDSKFLYDICRIAILGINGFVHRAHIVCDNLAGQRVESGLHLRPSASARTSGSVEVGWAIATQERCPLQIHIRLLQATQIGNKSTC
jgi:hypothetical protein